MNIALVSLGCPKNQCDADVLCRSLVDAGHKIVPSLEQADMALVNTCAFIESAKQEAIEAILTCCACKETRPDFKVLVTGCLAQRYGEDIMREIPEADGVMGIGANENVVEIVNQVAAGARPLTLPPKELLPVAGPRLVSTPSHYAYLKIAEGCSNRCHYCAIPLIRGRLRSRPMEDAVAEARWLARGGVKELIVVAQDITAYGEDLYGEVRLPQLLQSLEEIEGIRWIRLLYTYPDRITPQLLSVMAHSEKILPYIDIPIQHINSDVLRSMNRKGDRHTIEDAFARLRAAVPGICLRTTVIAGYPGETQAQFEELCAWVKTAGIDRLGCFAYSEEEGTVAYTRPQMPMEERQRRADRVMEIQAGVMAEKQAALVGTEQVVICDGYSEEDGAFVCRTAFDAPDIDGICYVPGPAPMSAGGFYTVRIESSDGCDLTAAFVRQA